MGHRSLPPRILANTRWRKSWPGEVKTITYNTWLNGKVIQWTIVPGNQPAIYRTASGFSPHSTTNTRPSCSDGCYKFNSSISATYSSSLAHEIRRHCAAGSSSECSTAGIATSIRGQLINCYSKIFISERWAKINNPTKQKKKKQKNKMNRDVHKSRTGNIRKTHCEDILGGRC